MPESEEAHAGPDQDWFREIATMAGDTFVVVRTQPDRAVEQLIGPLGAAVAAAAKGDERSAEEIAKVLPALVDPRDSDTLTELMATAPGQTGRGQLRWREPFAAAIWTDVTVRARRRGDGSVVLEGVVRDISEQKRVEALLAESEELYRLLAENAYDVIWTMALDGTITYVSPAVERMRGITPAEAARQTLPEIHPPESAARVTAYYERLFAAIEAGTELPVFRGEQEYYRRDGSIMVGELQVIPHVNADGEVVQILGVTRDISDRKQLEAHLTQMAVTDPLTGSRNRRYGEEMLLADIAEAQRYGTPLSLLVLDVDEFKAVNDTHGHPAADRVLVDLTQVVNEHLRSSDILVRWGGDEFCVRMRHCTLEDGVALAERLRTLIARTEFAGVGRVTVSIGAAELEAGDDLESWFDRADQAMYEAKASGRDRVVARRAAPDHG